VARLAVADLVPVAVALDELIVFFTAAFLTPVVFSLASLDDLAFGLTSSLVLPVVCSVSCLGAPNIKSISRMALSTASLPCTAFCDPSVPNKARILSSLLVKQI
jgi:membrane protein required for beta-lactamase induction